MKLTSLKNERFASFEKNKIVNPMNIFGGKQTDTWNLQHTRQDSMDLETKQRGVSCDGKACDWKWLNNTSQSFENINAY